ncbi:MAG: hypothetical protein K1X88_11310, partial [Nannocystaceae bacterium]|nr:hypothetical protein [Nannocystaceae bacterium]
MAALMFCACGASASDAGGTGGGTASSDASSGAATSTSATGSTTEMQGCWRHVEGGLVVGDESDLDELRNIVSVTGEFQIALQQNYQADLSFLECLESADMLFITGNVRSTAGMVRLSTLRSLVVDAPSSLEVVEGLDGVDEIGAIILPLYHKVERLDLPSLRRLDKLSIGGCLMGQVTPPPGPLTSLAGFDSLEYLEELTVEGNPSLTDTAILDDLIANQAPPLVDVSFLDNVSLSTADVVAKLDVLGVGTSSFCGNLGEDPC